MKRKNCKIFTDKRIKACDDFCDLQYRDSLIASSSAHEPGMQRGTHVSIDLERCSDCNSILYKEFKKAYHGPISSQMLTMKLLSFCY